MKTNLHDSVDHKLFRLLNDFVFHQVSLSQIIDDYSKDTDTTKDKNGKKLYQRIDSELRERGKSRMEIIELIVDYLTEHKKEQISAIVTFLKKLF